jgi:hypothetical protein
MTLIVSLRIADGIVIAGDSFSTMISQIEIGGEIAVKCPGCGHEQKIEPKAQIPLPASTFSFAQKVFPFMKSYGVGTFGAGQLARKTMYFAIKELERELENKKVKLAGVTEAANKIAAHVHKLVKIGISNLDQSPDDWYSVGFQVVGYDEGKAKTIEIKLGKNIKLNTFDHPSGCTVSGETRLVIEGIWKLYKKYPQDQAGYSVFSLQDAIDYSEFLINTTARYQRFSRSLSTVGGEIDIGLVTPFHGFKWIRQKSLGKILEGGQ